MPFRVQADGTIECDDVDEALALQSRLLGKKPAPSSNGEKRNAPASHRPTPSAPPTAQPDYDGLFAALREHEQSRLLLGALARHPEGLDTSDMPVTAGVETRALPPVMRNLSTLSVRYGFGENGLVEREEVKKDGRLKSKYKLKTSVAQEVKRRIET